MSLPKYTNKINKSFSNYKTYLVRVRIINGILFYSHKFQFPKESLIVTNVKHSLNNFDTGATGAKYPMISDAEYAFKVWMKDKIFNILKIQS